MRLWIIAAALAAGLNACTALEAPPAVYASSGWRTANGAPLSMGEVEALRISCRPSRMSSPLDSDQPVANTIRDNPIYHPGGEGLANAPPTGIAARADHRLGIEPTSIADLAPVADHRRRIDVRNRLEWNGKPVAKL